jgi:hypothetical protein
MFAVSTLSEIAVKATQITRLAAGREYLRFFFNPVGCICRLYRQYGPVTALGSGGIETTAAIRWFLQSARNSTACSLAIQIYSDRPV